MGQYQFYRTCFATQQYFQWTIIYSMNITKQHEIVIQLQPLPSTCTPSKPLYMISFLSCWLDESKKLKFWYSLDETSAAGWVKVELTQQCNLQVLCSPLCRDCTSEWFFYRILVWSIVNWQMETWKTPWKKVIGLFLNTSKVLHNW